MIAPRHVPLAVAATAAALLGAAAAIAQTSIAPPPPPDIVPPHPTVVEMPATGAATTTRANLSTLPSAQSVLQNLLRDKNPGVEPGTAPATGVNAGAVATGPAPETAPGGLIREGATISGRTGRLARKDAGHFEFIFDPVPEAKGILPPMGIIPSRRLAALEEASESGTRNVKFTIDADVTQYRGKNYLYIKDSDAPTPAATTPATLRATPVVDAAAPDEPPAIRIRERETIYNRVGRLVKDEKSGTMVFAFDSDGKQMTDPPMGVVPSRYLAVMEDATDFGARPLKFRISAKVTQYRGKNYLLLQFVQAVRDLNQGLGG